MLEVGFTNASKLDKVSGPQTFRPKSKKSLIARPPVSGSNNPLSTTMDVRHTICILKKINSNPITKCGMVPTKIKVG